MTARQQLLHAADRALTHGDGLSLLPSQLDSLYIRTRGIGRRFGSDRDARCLFLCLLAVALKDIA